MLMAMAQPTLNLGVAGKQKPNAFLYNNHWDLTPVCEIELTKCMLDD